MSTPTISAARMCHNPNDLSPSSDSGASGGVTGSPVGTEVGVPMSVGVDVGFGSAVAVGAEVGAGVDFGVAVAVGTGVGVAVAVGTGVGVEVAAGTGVGVAVAVGTGVSVGVPCAALQPLPGSMPFSAATSTSYLLPLMRPAIRWLIIVSVWTPSSSFHWPAGVLVEGTAEVRQRTRQAVMTAPSPPMYWGSTQVTLSCPLPLPALTFASLSGTVQVVARFGTVGALMFKLPSYACARTS